MEQESAGVGGIAPDCRTLSARSNVSRNPSGNKMVLPTTLFSLLNGLLELTFHSRFMAFADDNAFIFNKSNISSN